MDIARFPETAVFIYQATRRDIPEDLNLRHRALQTSLLKVFVLTQRWYQSRNLKFIMGCNTRILRESWAFAAVRSRSSIFWDVAPRQWLVCYRRSRHLGIPWPFKMGPICCPETSMEVYWHCGTSRRSKAGVCSSVRRLQYTLNT